MFESTPWGGVETGGHIFHPSTGESIPRRPPNRLRCGSFPVPIVIPVNVGKREIPGILVGISCSFLSRNRRHDHSLSLERAVAFFRDS